jgi:hypothetical protein
MKKRGGKRGQFQMPFNMVFSIILIVFFLATAFIAIRYFINLKSCGEVGLFLDDFQENVDSIWREQSAESIFEANLPGNIKYVCFSDLNQNARGENKEIYSDLQLYSTYNANLFFWPPEKACEIPYKNIRHLNITGVIKKDNPYCIKANGKLEIKMQKGFEDALVSIA